MSEWISVSDRLPPPKEGRFPSELVLVFCPNNGVRVGYSHQGKMNVQCGYCEEEMKITHWMPLPEPPK